MTAEQVRLKLEKIAENSETAEQALSAEGSTTGYLVACAIKGTAQYLLELWDKEED